MRGVVRAKSSDGFPFVQGQTQLIYVGMMPLGTLRSLSFLPTVHCPLSTAHCPLCLTTCSCCCPLPPRRRADFGRDSRGSWRRCCPYFRVMGPRTCCVRRGRS